MYEFKVGDRVRMITDGDYPFPLQEGAITKVNSGFAVDVKLEKEGLAKSCEEKGRHFFNNEIELVEEPLFPSNTKEKMEEVDVTKFQTSEAGTEKYRVCSNGDVWVYDRETHTSTIYSGCGQEQTFQGTIEEAIKQLQDSRDKAIEEHALEMECTVDDLYDYAHGVVGCPTGDVPVDVYERDEPQLGAKFDSDKPMLSILTKGCPRALMAVGQALTYGAEKYGESPDKLNFLEVPNGFNRYSDAMMRHHLQESLEDLDESGLEHITLTAVNALFRLELYLRAKENDNGN